LARCPSSLLARDLSDMGSVAGRKRQEMSANGGLFAVDHLPGKCPEASHESSAMLSSGVVVKRTRKVSSTQATTRQADPRGDQSLKDFHELDINETLMAS
jgi:hypothetical protein